MLDPSDITDYIYQELSKISSMYECNEFSKRTNTLNLHCINDEVISKNALNSFITLMRGVVRRSESAYIEIEGPLLVFQTCFLNNEEHVHYEWKVTTTIQSLF